MPRYRFGRPPAKGTKARAFLLAALRQEGVSSWEIGNALGWRSSLVAANARILRDQKGYDLRLIQSRGRGCNGRGPQFVYRLVGKMRWDGSYRSFISALARDA